MNKRSCFLTMKKEMFDKIQEAEIFDLYGAKIEDSNTNSGVFIKKSNGEAFDLNISIQNQN